MEPIKVLLVDDHALFRKGVASALGLQRDIEVVGEASNGQEALTKARELMPDVILMDISMPGMDGLEATRRIKAEVPHVKIIILTVAEEDKSLFEAIKSGAHGYLLKTIEPRPLLETLRGVFKGEAPISRVTASKILGEFARQSQSAGPEEASPVGKLSPREHEILELLIKGATNGDRRHSRDQQPYREEPSAEHHGEAAYAEPRPGRRLCPSGGPGQETPRQKLTRPPSPPATHRPTYSR